MSPMDRRHFLRVGGAFGALGVGAPFALQLACCYGAALTAPRAVAPGGARAFVAAST